MLWLSASQIDTFGRDDREDDDPEAGCMRKWAYDKLDRIPREQNESAQQGTEGHAQAEHYLKGEFHQLDLTQGMGARFAVGMHHLPPPMMPGMLIEHHFGLNLGSALYQGYIDVYLPGGWFRPGIPFIHDHKFTGNFVWAKTPEKLLNDTQCNLYAAVGMADAGTNECDAQWLYYKRKGETGSKPVHQTIKRDERHLTVLHHIDETAKKIRAVYDAGYTSALQLPPNPHHCDAYGGCVHKQRCNLSDTERFFSIMSQAQSTDAQAFLTSLQGGAPNAPAVPQPGPQNGPLVHQPSAIMGDGYAAQPPPQQPAQPQQMPPQQPMAQPVVQQQPVMPQPQPQQPAPMAQPLQAPPPQQPAQGYPAPPAQPPMQPPMQPMQQPPMQGPPAMVPPAPQAVKTAEPQKRKRRTAEEKAREEGFILYIDCVPVKTKRKAEGEYEDFAMRASRVMQAINAHYGVQHYTMIQGQDGAIVWQMTIRQDIEANIPTKPVYVDTRTREGADAVGPLRERAKAIYQGVK